MTNTRSTVVAVMACTLALWGAGAFSPRIGATHAPADKIGVSASVIEEMHTQVGPGGGTSGPITLLSSTMRNSTPTDVIIHVTGECAVWTDVVTTDATPTSQSIATVSVWAELDGVTVPVTSDANRDGVPNDADDGRVIFCNRDFKVNTVGLLPGQLLDLFIKTRSANAFNWAALNVGSGIHTLEVKGQLDVLVNGTGIARAAVGKRTLVAEPAKLANDATF